MFNTSWATFYKDVNLIRDFIFACYNINGLLFTTNDPGSWNPSWWGTTLQWRHNDHDGVSNHQPHGCLLNRLFRRRSKKTSKLRVTGLCVGNSPGPMTSPHKGPVTRKMFPFDDVIMSFEDVVMFCCPFLRWTQVTLYKLFRMGCYELRAYRWLSYRNSRVNCLVTLYDAMDLAQHCFRSWLQSINWTNGDVNYNLVA